MDIFHYQKGTLPVLVNMPHTATHVPEDILERFNAPAKHLPDTDWHIHLLYAFAGEMGAHLLMPTHSRSVIDLNRPPDNESLYPGQFTTGLCPRKLFDGSPIYQDGKEPDEAEVAQRLDTYWQPYHAQLQAVLKDLKANHGRVVLFDAHSIRSVVPNLFDGALPDLNLGTADNASADAALSQKLFDCLQQSPYSAVMNGRFKGGYITRHYGNPAGGIHAVQLELAQKNYMHEDYPFAYDEAKAGQLQQVLRPFVQILIDFVS